MSVGVLGGTGPLGSALAARLSAAGDHVVLGSRDAVRAEASAGELRRRWPGVLGTLRAGPNEEAASCDEVVIATPWDAAVATASAHSASLAGKLVVSVGNALGRFGREVVPLLPGRGSVAQSLQAALPASRVAGAFHHLPASRLGDPGDPLGLDVLICADTEDALAEAARLVERIPGLRALEAGSLALAGAIESFTAVLVALNVRHKAQSSVAVEGITSRAVEERRTHSIERVARQ